MSIHGPSSLRRRTTSTRTLRDAAAVAVQVGAQRLGAHPVRARAQQREDLGQPRAQLGALVADLQRARGRGRGSRAWPAGARSRRRPARDSTACTTNASSVGETGSATAGTPDGSTSEPPPGGIASRPATPQPCGTAPIARPDGVISAERSGDDAVAVAGVQARVALLQRELEAGLDGARGRGGDGEAVRVDGAEVAREVDHADHRAGVRVVDRRRAARPALHRIAEVLGPEDLDRVVERDRGADRVRARAALAPQRALGEVHVAGGAQAHAAPSPRSSSACRWRRETTIR